MIRKRLPLFVCFLFLFITVILMACSTGAGPGEISPRREPERIFFTVTNNNWSNIVVYLVKESGMRDRLGTVTSMAQEKFSVRYISVGSGRLYFCLHLIGGNDFCYPPEGFSVNPDSEVDFKIANYLPFSTIFIR